MRFYEVRWEPSAKLASCANGSPVLKINFVLPGNNHNLIPELKASRHSCDQPKLIRDAATKRKVLQMLESATRGIDRLDAVTKRLDPNTVKGLLDKLQVPPLNEIADIRTLQNVVLGLEELAGPTQPHAA